MTNQPYASGNWHVRAGEEDAFIQRWKDFLGWTRDNVPDLDSATLVRSSQDGGHFLSFAAWGSDAAREKWQNSEGFTQRFAACRELCDEFEGGNFEAVAVV